MLRSRVIGFLLCAWLLWLPTAAGAFTLEDLLPEPTVVPSSDSASEGEEVPQYPEEHPADDSLCQPRTMAPDGSYMAPPRGLVWRIESPDGAWASYLMGTYHSAKPDVLAKLSLLNHLWPEVDHVLVELVQSSAETQQYLQQQMRLQGGKHLRDMVGDTLYSRAVMALQAYGVPEDMTRTYQPWAIAITLNLPLEDLKEGEVLDALIERSAQQQGKTVKGLETADEQMAFFVTLPLTDQKQLLQDALDNLHQKDQWLKQLETHYLNEELQGLYSMSDSLHSQSGDPDLSRRFTKALIDDRNQRMLERMVPYLQQGAALVAVGALHLPGEAGLLHLLEKEGYCLSPVTE